MESAALKNEQYIDANPIKYCQFDWIPRHITSRKDITPALKLIMSVLYGALGQDCRLMFKERTLANKTGMSVATIKRAIKKGRELRLFITIETGRGLVFKLIRQVAQNDPSLIIEKRNTIKQTTTGPQIEPIPKKDPKKPPEPIPIEAPVGAVVAVSEIRKLIPPEISFRLNDATIKSLSNIDKGHIQYAAKEATDSNAKNKPGLFIKLVREKKPPMCEQINSLKPVPIPTDIDGNSNQMKIIVCYNRNTSGCGCSVMTGTQQPGTDCKKYCPFVNLK